MSYQENEQDDKIFEEMRQFIQILKQQTLSPEILPFKGELFQSLKEAIQDQNDRIKTYVQPDPEGNDVSNHEKNFKQLIYYSETEKIHYLLKQYLRVRLKKITNYAFYISRNFGLMNLLSLNEQAFFKKYVQMKFQYLYKHVLKDNIPNRKFHSFGEVETRLLENGQSRQAQQSSQIETEQTMINFKQPNLKQYCFVLIAENGQHIRYNDILPLNNFQSEGIIPENQIIFAPYENVHKLIKEGKAYLI